MHHRRKRSRRHRTAVVWQHKLRQVLRGAMAFLPSHASTSRLIKSGWGTGVSKGDVREKFDQ